VSGERTRVVVVDDQWVIRAGLQTIVDNEPDMVVVGQAEDGLRAIEEVSRHHPDVVLMDIRMPRLDGIEATRKILQSVPGQLDERRIAVLVLTTFDDEEYLLEAVRTGAAGFLLKDAGPDALVQAVRTVRAGDRLIDPTMTRVLIERCLDLERRAGTLTAQRQGSPTTWERRLGTLSGREKEILVGMARGRSNRELADHLVLGETTVKTHVSHVLGKLGLSSRVQAVVLAYEAGVVRPGEGTLRPTL
jgi:DNA-binding NarL/FixJ family response regulator